MKRTLVVVSDLHAGSTVALCCPEAVSLSDGGSYEPSPAQKWLYENWLDFWKRVKQARKGSDWLGFLLNGDLVDGDHHGTFQIISKDPGVQTWVLNRVMEPALELKPDWIAVVRGTGAHVGEAATPEESFARHLRKQLGFKVAQDAATRMYSHWYLNLDLDGTRISATHHGRIGGRPWTKANAVIGLAAQIAMEYIGDEAHRPHLAFRSHFHTYQDSHDAQVVRVIQTPAWQLHTAYGYRVVPETLADIGGLIVTLEPGKEPVIEKVLYRPKRSPVVKP